MEELQERLKGTEDLHGSASLRMSCDSLDFPAAKPTPSCSNNLHYVDPKLSLSTVSLTRLDFEPVNNPDMFSTTLSCPDLMFDFEFAPQPFHLRPLSLEQKFDSQETLKADEDDEDFIPSNNRPFFLEFSCDENAHFSRERMEKRSSFENFSSSSSTTYITCSETSLVSGEASNFVRSQDFMQLEKNGSSTSSLAYFTPTENTPVSSNCPSPVPFVNKEKLLRLSLEKARKQSQVPAKSNSTPSSPVPAQSEADQMCHTLPRAAKKHRSPSPCSNRYSEERAEKANNFSVDAASLFPLEPRTLNLSSIPSQLHTADSFEELQEFLLLESQCIVEKIEKSNSSD